VDFGLEDVRCPARVDAHIIRPEIEVTLVVLLYRPLVLV
jgi:hypothetical protein